MEPMGLYLHVPFCRQKCPYCDFYSLCADEFQREQYVTAMENCLTSWAEKLGRPARTLYLGGGTPSLLGGSGVARLVQRAKKEFGLLEAEVTVEVNPGEVPDAFFEQVAAAGVNRISMGLQSADPNELAQLGRRHRAPDVVRAVKRAREAGIQNISLDLMLAVPGQTNDSLQRSVSFCAELGVSHVSAYLLKIEPGTPFAKQKLDLPDEDETADQYLFACNQLERYGFLQYEISNFARKGMESRHNLIYWKDEEYLGIGPSAHSFLDGKRFYYPRDLRGFLQGGEPVPDGTGGSREEYAMLRLRLREGLTDALWQSRFSEPLPRPMLCRAKRFVPAGLIECGDGWLRLTPKGFLVSNSLIGELVFSEREEEYAKSGPA